MTDEEFRELVEAGKERADEDRSYHLSEYFDIETRDEPIRRKDGD